MVASRKTVFVNLEEFRNQTLISSRFFSQTLFHCYTAGENVGSSPCFKGLQESPGQSAAGWAGSTIRSAPDPQGSSGRPQPRALILASTSSSLQKPGSIVSAQPAAVNSFGPAELTGVLPSRNCSFFTAQLFETAEILFFWSQSVH